MALVVSSALEMKGLPEEFMFMFFLYYYPRDARVNGVIHGERLIGVGSDRISETVLLYYGSTQADGAIYRKKLTGVGSDGIVEMVLLFYILCN